MAAIIYDTFLVLPVIMASVVLVMGIRTLLVGAPAQDTIAPLDADAVRLVALLTIYGFFSWFWLKNGQTLGMQAWRLKLVRLDDGDLTFKDALLRCIAASFSVACLGLGYLWRWIDRDGLYWHDRLSSTRLTLIPAQEKSANRKLTAASTGPEQQQQAE